MTEKSAFWTRALVLLAMLAVLVLLSLMAGCAATDYTYHKAVDANWKAIRPEYVRYLDADATLSDVEREALMTTVEMFDATIAEHGKYLDGND